MRKELGSSRRWDGSKWIATRRYIETDTGVVYHVVMDFAPKFIPVDELPTGTAIDKYKYMPAMRPDWPVYQGSLDDPSVYIKKPVYTGEEDKAHWERESWEQELEVIHTPGFEHPHLATFHGCVVENGHVAGMAFSRLATTLAETAAPYWRTFDQSGDAPKITTDGIPFDLESVMNGILPAIEHLKSLGLVYLDLKPDNIMWAWAATDTNTVSTTQKTKTGHWCLIDFGEVYPLGKSFEYPPGTPGWTSETGGIAEDLLDISLAILTRWLATGKDNDADGHDNEARREYMRIIQGLQRDRKEREASEGKIQDLGV